MVRSYKYYDLIMAGFVTCLLCANLIGVTKVSEVGGFTFGTAILFFPITYLFGDVLTEVYGYARSRRVVWAGFTAMIFATIMSQTVLALPPAKTWTHQAELEFVFGGTPRVVLASLVAFFCGEFVNAFVMARMKVQTGGKQLWLRAIASTIAGEAIDSLIFYPIAFYGAWDTPLLLQVMGGNYAVKVVWEIVAMPLTYRIVNFLKKSEGVDHFDHDTNFTPFSIDV